MSVAGARFHSACQKYRSACARRLGKLRALTLLILVLLIGQTFCPPGWGSIAHSQTFVITQLAICTNEALFIDTCAQVAPPFDRLHHSNFSGNNVYVVASVLC
jgi:hypothetical protein